jgi:hypothetical protein
LNAATIRVILGVPLLQFAPWLAIVLLVTWAGYPGVVCVTPLAWLIALRVGLVCAAQSASPRAAQRLREAALAGGWFGFMQGALFWIVVPRLGEVKFNEQVSATLLSLAMIGVGVLAGAGLAVFTAHQVERRRQAA